MEHNHCASFCCSQPNGNSSTFPPTRNFSSRSQFSPFHLRNSHHQLSARSRKVYSFFLICSLMQLKCVRSAVVSPSDGVLQKPKRIHYFFGQSFLQGKDEVCLRGVVERAPQENHQVYERDDAAVLRVWDEPPQICGSAAVVFLLKSYKTLRIAYLGERIAYRRENKKSNSEHLQHPFVFLKDLFPFHTFE